MDLWIWILLAAAVIVLIAVLVWASRSIRPKVPDPLGSVSSAASTPRADPRNGSAPSPLPGNGPPLGPDMIAQIDALVAGGQKIAAIKLLRDRLPLSLRDAKDRIDAWVPAGPGSAAAFTAPVAQAPRAADAVAHLSPAVRAEIDRLVVAKQKIPAIKLLREATGLGLKDSKDIIDAWR